MSIFVRATRAAYLHSASPFTRVIKPRHFSSPKLTRVGMQHIKSPYLSSAKFSTSAHSYTKVDLRKAAASSFFAGTFLGLTFSQLYYSAQQSSEASSAKKVSPPRVANKSLKLSVKAAVNSSDKICLPFVITTEQVAKTLGLKTFDVCKIKLHQIRELIDYKSVDYPTLTITLKSSFNRDDLNSICTLLKKEDILCSYDIWSSTITMEGEDVENFVRYLQNQSEQELSYVEKAYSYLLDKIESDREVLLPESIIVPKKYSSQLRINEYRFLDEYKKDSYVEEAKKYLPFTLTRENAAEAFGIKVPDIRKITAYRDIRIRLQPSFKNHKRMNEIVAQFQKEGVDIDYCIYPWGGTLEIKRYSEINIIRFAKAFKKLLSSNE